MKKATLRLIQTTNHGIEFCDLCGDEIRRDEAQYTLKTFTGDIDMCSYCSGELCHLIYTEEYSEE